MLREAGRLQAWRADLGTRYPDVPDVQRIAEEHKIGAGARCDAAVEPVSGWNQWV